MKQSEVVELSPGASIAAKQPRENGASSTIAAPGGTGITSGKSLLIAFLVFASVLLVINRDLFRQPIIEYYDFAANALQVQRAMHFRELLGNYSRWGFHHPGPAFFYFLALGEYVFHNWLRTVPAAMNAHILTITLINSAFLFSAIRVFSAYIWSRLFAPAAIALSLVFVYVVNDTIPGSAIVSVWMPHVLLFCFLLFLTACASVATGKMRHLPILTFTGLMLMHGHVAQVLFVTVLGALAVAVALTRRRPRMPLLEVFRQNRTPVLTSAVLVVVFALPVVLDVVLHKPSNLYDINWYLSTHRGIQNSFGTALKYEESFLAFTPDPEVVFRDSSPHLLSRGGSQPCVVKYWGLAVFMLGAATALGIKERSAIPFFVKYIALEIVLTFLLFFYWSLKMAGPLSNFNGHFIYSVQLLALWVLAGIILDALRVTARDGTVLLLSCAMPLLMFTSRSSFRNAELGHDETNPLIAKLRSVRNETNRLIASLPNEPGPLHLSFAREDWPFMIGVASHLKREHRPFCVDYVWALEFGEDNVCRDQANVINLVLTHQPSRCDAPCQVLAQDGRFRLDLNPYPYLTLPATLDASGASSLNRNFYEGDAIWSSHDSSLLFRLSPTVEKPRWLRIRILGWALPERPVQISLNGHLLGTINGAAGVGAQIFEFVTDGELLRPEAENDLSFYTEKAAPVGLDKRNLGFLFMYAKFDAEENRITDP